MLFGTHPEPVGCGPVLRIANKRGKKQTTSYLKIDPSTPDGVAKR
jgi:hypothetical protein